MQIEQVLMTKAKQPDQNVRMEGASALRFNGAEGCSNGAQKPWCQIVCCNAVAKPSFSFWACMSTFPSDELRSYAKHMDEEEAYHKLKDDSLSHRISGHPLHHFTIGYLHIQIKRELFTLDNEKQGLLRIC